MYVAILGPLRVGAGNTSAILGAKKIRATLAMLALRAGQVVSFDELIDELWGETPLKNARNALQANVTRMRRSLGQLGLDSGEQGVVRTVGNGYLLSMPATSLDANRFLQQVREGHDLVGCQPEKAAERLRGSLAMWHGPALVDVGDGPRCRAAALRLDEQRRLAHEDLISAQLASGEAGAVVPELRQLHAEHPERERFSEQLMLALYRTGRQSEAIDIFHRTRRRLDEELGLLPGRELNRLYQAILTQDASLSL
ncbi:AfsR/SARP family transcriptional regulator [Streptacidiphilus melanogenes]|uniref:AfsR/SARP family transcriptional regulator n=1 Tax=Streptacidiphilus melanogenes TaxID=411235 RepID=UPI000A03130F|nr:AfsR/SARP family transcriptional regulator [Streptacidiphilus melanogenes]